MDLKKEMQISFLTWDGFPGAPGERFTKSAEDGGASLIYLLVCQVGSSHVSRILDIKGQMFDMWSQWEYFQINKEKSGFWGGCFVFCFVFCSKGCLKGSQRLLFNQRASFQGRSQFELRTMRKQGENRGQGVDVICGMCGNKDDEDKCGIPRCSISRPSSVSRKRGRSAPLSHVNTTSQ